jgi:hypothetical protein
MNNERKDLARKGKKDIYNAANKRSICFVMKTSLGEFPEYSHRKLLASDEIKEYSMQRNLNN